MSKEYFWGDELSGSKKEIKWNPSFEEDDDDDDDTLDMDGIQHFLFLKQAVLGVDAKEGERNVVEISSENFEGDDVKQPLFSLKLGLNESSILDIAVQPPVTLSLVSGSGPVYLNGQHMIEINAENEDEEDELEEEEFDTKAIPDNPVTKSKKRPLSTSESIAKKMKMAKEDEDDHDEEEEEDEEMPVMEELDDDDDDDEDEDDEDLEGEEEDEDEEDSDEDEDENEEEEEEEDDESPEKPVKKVRGMKGKINGTATAKGDNLKTKEATSSVTKSKGKKKIFGLDEIKKKLQESSGLPKKEGKFKNYIRSTFHMTDSKKLSDVWGWYRASLQK